jgi:putative ABC transport system permease protein
MASMTIEAGIVELDTHLAMLTEENLRRGLSSEEVRRKARVQLGGITQLREIHREMWSLLWLETLLQDVRYGLRQLRRNPGFSLAAISIAALGIAATCVVFAFADAAVFRALPYQNVSHLAAVALTDLKDNPNWNGVPVPVFLSWHEHAGTIGRFAARYAPLKSKTLVGGAEPMQVFDKQVSQGTFRLFGVRPLIGREFQASDYDTTRTHAVILSYSLWQHLFDGRPDLVGKTVMMDGVGRTIVGVMPPNFLLPESSAASEPACWTPLVFNAKQKSATGDFSLDVWVRLRPGITRKQALATLTGLALQIVNPMGARKASDWCVQATPLMRQVVGRWRSVLIFLLGAVGFLLAIACANVANLLLARANTRQKEIAVRTAIGACRTRLVRQMLTESLILSALAGAIGILLAHVGIGLERGLLPRSLGTANFQQMGIDPRILAATVAVSVMVGVVFGLAPAFNASKVDLVGSLKEGQTNAGTCTGRWNTQSTLVAAEVALSLIMTTGAALMLRSFLKLEGVQPGFNPHEMLTMRVLLPKYRYPKVDDRLAAYQELVHKVNSLPGIQAAAFVTPLPLTGINATVGLPVQPGMSNVPESGKLGIGFHAVSPGYFKTMGIPLLRGRVFTEQDTRNSEPVTIVNKTFVDRYWPDLNPVGKVFYPAYPKLSRAAHVTGEVDSVRGLDLAEEPRPELYNPFTQYFFAEFAGTLIVKTTTPASAALAMERAVHSVDPEAPISQVATMRQVLTGSLAEKRLYVLLVGVFAVLAVLLAATGISSTVSYAVSRRIHEVGIRMALGAGRSEVLFLMLRQTLRPIVAGIVLGAAGSFVLTRFISSQLYGISPTDPPTLVSVAAFLGLISVIASIIPATRAASVDPAETLRTI